MRTYTYASGDIPKVLDGWSKAIEAREGVPPLAACWTSELGGLNKFVHTWVYKDLTERTRVREASRQAGGPWPPQTGVRPIRQENKLLMPAAFSPVRWCRRDDGTAVLLGGPGLWVRRPAGKQPAPTRSCLRSDRGE